MVALVHINCEEDCQVTFDEIRPDVTHIIFYTIDGEVGRFQVSTSEVVEKVKRYLEQKGAKFDG